MTETILTADIENALKLRAERLGKEFTIDEANKETTLLICKYFANELYAEVDGAWFSNNKGLFLSGNIGCGKTFLMKLLQVNPIYNYRVVNCREVASDFAKDGDAGIEKYIKIYEQPPQKHHDPAFRKQRLLNGYCFDDFGTEPDKKYYGSEVNVMLEVLLHRYDKGDFFTTHITTNINITELKERYGSRLTSRMKEMFNFINFPETATDRRK